MVEYATITAAMAILAASLAGAFASALPSTNVKAATAVARVATKQHVSGADARAAYAKAPFRRPVLRYLYAVGWVGAVRDLASCHAGLLLGPGPKAAAAQSIRRSPKVLARLRAAHVTVSQAATAVGRGATDGCA